MQGERCGGEGEEEGKLQHIVQQVSYGWQRRGHLRKKSNGMMRMREKYNRRTHDGWDAGCRMQLRWSHKRAVDRRRRVLLCLPEDCKRYENIE
jgi:hypothetical protein